VKTVERALFAGYVFCRVVSDRVAKIVTTPGVIRIVGDGSGPLPVACDEIAALQRVVAASVTVEPWEFLQAGQRVRVIDGPLRDSEGIVLRTMNRHRLIVSVSLLQRSVAVEVNPAWVQMIDHRSADGRGYAVPLRNGAITPVVAPRQI
jgi:transcription antitermination factor NusG